ncbi:MAG: Brp/Blh family beta-carotene 15,15'-dioxygenase [Thalassobaculaceae bacterium]
MTTARLPWIMGGASASVVLGLALAQLSLAPQTVTLLAAVAVLVFGIPHGAFDRISIQGPLRPSRDGLLAALRFFLAYAALAGAFAGFWLLVPQVALPAFLLLSVFHFGAGDCQDGPIWRRVLQLVAHGGAVVTLIPAFHPAEVTEIFGFLSDSGTARALVSGLSTALQIWLAVALIYSAFALASRRHRWRAGELLVVAAGCALLPPMLGFLLYFTVFHGPRHLANVLDADALKREHNAAVLAEAGAISAISLVAFVAIMAAGGDWLAAESTLRTLFIFLAALTIPHMLLVDLGPLISARRSRPVPATGRA